MIRSISCGALAWSMLGKVRRVCAASDAATRPVHSHHCHFSGYGLTRAYILCLERAMQEPGDAAPVVFLEDDARLFDAAFCDAGARQRLWDAAPSDAFVIM